MNDKQSNLMVGMQISPTEVARHDKLKMIQVYILHHDGTRRIDESVSQNCILATALIEQLMIKGDPEYENRIPRIVRLFETTIINTVEKVTSLTIFDFISQI